MILQCLFGLKEVSATEEIVSESVVIHVGSPASILLTTDFWCEVLDALLYVPVMSVQGIHDVFLAEGSINGDFLSGITMYLFPVLLQFNGINSLSVTIHSFTMLNQVRISLKAKEVFLSPYSPDLNPLEPVFGKVKAILKENDNQHTCMCY